ncbi:MAG: 4Fe-4S dicluster domain-containing protein [Candidatus Accumulibacter sp.]|nr:4Fe-4S dicluster domain-containing protein [Accumulibacter sp.]
MIRKIPVLPRPSAQGSPALRRVRVAAAVLVFAVALAAFIDFRDIVPNSLKHLVASVQFVPSAFTFATAFRVSAFACLAVLALTFACGRVYCSVICPLGILQDAMARISANIRRVPSYKLPYRKPRNALRYAILAITIASLAIGWGGLAIAWLDPYSNFGRIASTLLRPVAVAVNNVAASIATALEYPAAVPHGDAGLAAAGALLPPLVIFIALAIMASARGRLWCNSVCPVGTLLGLVSRRSLWRISVDNAVCVKCGDCLRACKAQCIDLRAGEIDFSRCVACCDCLSVCGEGGVKYRWHGLAGKRPATPSSKDKISAGSRSQTPANTGRRIFIATAATGALAWAAVSRDAAGADERGCADRQEHDFSKLDDPEVVAPPGGRSTARILAQCTACQLCVSACPSRVIEPAVLHYGSLMGFMKPRLDFDQSFCNINCTVCTDVCPDGALTPLTLEAKQTTRIGLAHVAHPRCIIVKDGTACGACAEHCPTAALQMKKITSHPDPLPVVDPRYCIGCGACQYACPTHPKAIVVSGIATHEKAEVLVQEQVKPTTIEDFAF